MSFREYLKESAGKLNPNEKVTIDIDYSPDPDDEKYMKQLQKKFKVIVKEGKGAQAFITGKRKDVIKFMKETGYDDDLNDGVYPDLM